MCALRLSILNNYHEPITWIKKQLSSDERTLQLTTCTSTDILTEGHITEDTLELLAEFTDTHTRLETLEHILYSAIKTFCHKINKGPIKQTFDLDSIYYFSNLGVHFNDDVVGNIIDVVFDNLEITCNDGNISTVIKLIRIINDIYSGDLYTLMLSRSDYANKSIKQSLSILRRESKNTNILIKSMQYMLILSAANNPQRVNILESMIIIDNKDDKTSISRDIEIALEAWKIDPVTIINEHTLSIHTMTKIVKLTAL